MTRKPIDGPPRSDPAFRSAILELAEDIGRALARREFAKMKAAQGAMMEAANVIDKATMRARDFLEVVVQPNMQLALEEPQDWRHAVNAVLTIDALIGVIFAECQASEALKLPEPTDDRYRDRLAQECASYRIVRDLAASIKHGELTRGKARLVKRPSQVMPVTNQVGLFQTGDRLGGSVLIIALSAGGARRASNVIAESYRMAKRLVEQLDGATGENGA